MKISGKSLTFNNYDVYHQGNKPIASDIKFTDGKTFQQKLDDGSLKGPQGATGPKGDTGAKGADGLTTSVTVNDIKYTHSSGNITLPNYPTLSSLGAASSGHTHTSFDTITVSKLLFANNDAITYDDDTNTFKFGGDGSVDGNSKIKAGEYHFANDDYITYKDATNEFYFYSDNNFKHSILVGGGLWMQPNSTEQTTLKVCMDAERLAGRTDLTIAPTKANYGIFGRSGYYFYVGWAAGWKTPSYRQSKYDIRKTDDSLLYDHVKNMNIYNYRRVRNVEDGQGPLEDHDYRGDLQMGALIDELPFEVVDHDTEMGEGKGVDLYGYSSMIAGALRHTMSKLEKLEEENEIMKDLIEKITIAGGNMNGTI